jgi:hypothetical protein
MNSRGHEAAHVLFDHRAQIDEKLRADPANRHRAWDLAHRYDNHPIYDMLYVALAERLGEPLITVDDKLRRRIAHLSLVLRPDEALRIGPAPSDEVPSSDPPRRSRQRTLRSRARMSAHTGCRTALQKGGGSSGSGGSAGGGGSGWGGGRSRIGLSSSGWPTTGSRGDRAWAEVLVGRW